MIKETSLFASFRELVEHCTRWSTEMLDDIYHMLQFFSDSKIKIQDADLCAFWKLAQVGLFGAREKVIAQSLNLLCKILIGNPDLALSIE